MRTRDEARQAVQKMMEEAAFGAAGKRIVAEEFLTGPELTVLAFTDGKTVRPMVSPHGITNVPLMVIKGRTPVVWARLFPELCVRMPNGMS